MYELQNDYSKSKYKEKSKLCHTDTDIVYTKMDGIYNEISEYVTTRSDTSNYELDGPLP